MKFLALVILFLCSMQLLAQKDSIVWNLKSVYEIGSEDIWTSDLQGNVYIYKDQVIHKYDSSGILKFNQSIKTLGNLESISVVNSLKIISFSEEQQLVCYLDNTLTKTEDCIDLLDIDIDLATLIAPSSRPDNLWIYDQMNNQLKYVSIIGKKNLQIIENIRGILMTEHIDMLLERNNRLYILVKGKGVFILDLYGSLENSILSEEIIAVDANENFQYLVSGKDLKILQFKLNREIVLPLPLENILEIRLDALHIYFRTNDSIYKYRLSIN